MCSQIRLKATVPSEKDPVRFWYSQSLQKKKKKKRGQNVKGICGYVKNERTFQTIMRRNYVLFNVDIEDKNIYIC